MQHLLYDHDKALIDEFFAFVHKIHWKVFWGLNLIVNDPRSAANEAAYVTAVGGAALIGFTIGNEPELYTKQGFRPSGWGYTDYLQEWDQYRKAVLNAVSSAKFAGPDACCDSPLFPNFLANERKNIVIATHHYYVGAIHQTPATLSLLLSEQVAQQFISDASEWSAMAREVRLPLEISESNTYSGGGVPGVSDSFAAALWASDYLFQAAELGIRRIDFQSSQFAIYNAIDDNGRPKALYYGLLFFHYVTEYAHIVQTTISAAYNITAYAVISSGGSLHVILVNKQNQHAATVEIDTGKLYHSASIIRLTAPSIGATSGITVGGGAVSAQGTWVPLSSESLPLSGTEVKVQVPAGSAASVDLIE